MIILDTSIWIEYFRNNPAYTLIIDDLLRIRQIYGFELIFGELLQGVKPHEKIKIIQIWDLLPKVQVPMFGYIAGLYSHNNQLLNKGVGLIDATIICAAIESKSKIWTLDKKILNHIDPEIKFETIL